MASILLSNGNVINGTADTPLGERNVLVTSGRIAEISDSAIKKPAECLEIDLAGRTLMPGLIDAHVHVTATTLNLGQMGSSPMSYTSQQAREIMEGMLVRGFTTVRDAGGADFGLARAVETGLIKGPRLFFSGKALSQTGGHGDFRRLTLEVDSCACASLGAELAQIADGVPDVQKAARNELRRGANQIKIMGSGGVASPRDPVWNLQYSEDEIRAIVWEATSWRTYVMAHCYTPEAISRAVSFGVRSIEHGNLLDAPTAALMAESNAILVPTLVTYEALHRHGVDYGMPEVSMGKLRDVRDAGLRSLEIAKAAGVPTVYGTDLLGETHHYQSLEFSIRGEVLSAMELIKSATGLNADLLQREGELGVIAAGAIADMIVVDGDPLRDLNLLQEQGKHLSLIMKGGQLFKNELN